MKLNVEKKITLIIEPENLEEFYSSLQILSKEIERLSRIWQKSEDYYPEDPKVIQAREFLAELEKELRKDNY